MPAGSVADVDVCVAVINRMIGFVARQVHESGSMIPAMRIMDFYLANRDF